MLVKLLVTWSQRLLLLGSILTPFMYFFPEYHDFFWDLSLWTVTILMCIRPLGNLFPKAGFYRWLPLRKELGIFSASIVVAFAFFHYVIADFDFWNMYFSRHYWPIDKSIFWAHLGELTGFILLITSNNFSIRLLKRYWKPLQRLAYVYFFSGAWYVFVAFDKWEGLFSLILVFGLTFLAFIKNHFFKK